MKFSSKKKESYEGVQVSKVASLLSSNLLRMNYFEGIFQEFWPQIRAYVSLRFLKNSRFWGKLPLAAGENFLFLNLRSIWSPVLHARIHPQIELLLEII